MRLIGLTATVLRLLPGSDRSFTRISISLFLAMHFSCTRRRILRLWRPVVNKLARLTELFQSQIRSRDFPIALDGAKQNAKGISRLQRYHQMTLENPARLKAAAVHEPGRQSLGKMGLLCQNGKDERLTEMPGMWHSLVGRKNLPR